jgi:hypothetical protein
VGSPPLDFLKQKGGLGGGTPLNSALFRPMHAPDWRSYRNKLGRRYLINVFVDIFAGNEPTRSSV